MKKALLLILSLLVNGGLIAQSTTIDSISLDEKQGRITYVKKRGCRCELDYGDNSTNLDVALLAKEYKRLRTNKCNLHGGVYASADMMYIAEKLRKEIKGYRESQILEIFGEPTYSNEKEWYYLLSSNKAYLVSKFKNEKVIGSQWKRYFD